MLLHMPTKSAQAYGNDVFGGKMDSRKESRFR